MIFGKGPLQFGKNLFLFWSCVTPWRRWKIELKEK